MRLRVVSRSMRTILITIAILTLACGSQTATEKKADEKTTTGDEKVTEKKTEAPAPTEPKAEEKAPEPPK